jgi:hypothetical protein
MFAANTYHIRLANDQDTGALGGLAERNSQQPFTGRVLIGEIDGVGAAALSLSDGRVVADSSPRIGNLVANLRVRAVSIWAYEAMPSLHDRLLAGLPAWYRAVAIAAPTSTPDDQSAEQEPVLVSA